MKILKKAILNLKHFRPYILLLDLPYWSQLKNNSTYFKKYGIKKKVWQGISFNDIPSHDVQNIPWLDKDILAEEIASKPAFKAFSSEIQEQILQWKQKGYLVIKDFFDKSRIDRLEQSLEGCLSEQELSAYRKNRIQDLWSKNTFVDEVFRDPRLIEVLSFILGREAVPFQTINFYKGTEQAAHSDSIHFTTEPFGYLIAVWVALEDITEGSGELIYYPGSHVLPFVTNRDYNHGNTRWKVNIEHYARYEDKIRDVVKGQDFKTDRFLAKKGDILVWHANLLHGGSKIKNKEVTRKSLVMHYYGKDVLCYHERVEKLAILSRLKKHFSC